MLTPSPEFTAPPHRHAGPRADSVSTSNLGARTLHNAEPWAKRLKFALLTRDPRQQLRLAQSGLANLLMLACVVMVWVLCRAGIVERGWMLPWAFCSIGGMLTVFALIRSGRALHWPDPSLTMPQMFFGVLCAASSYLFLASERALALPVISLILMFGMFGMNVRDVRIIGAYTVVVFAIVSAVVAQSDPSPAARPVEVAHLMMVGITATGIVVLGTQLHRMRRQSREQRVALSAALARISELATRDPLTGCFNRRAIVDWTDKKASPGAAASDPLCIALFDLDHFKGINDRHGHATGDAVLRRFAEIAASTLRATDVLSRWGGEEFVLVLVQTVPGAAQSCVQRVLDSFAAEHFTSAAGVEFTVTCSAGFTEQRQGEDLFAAVERADVAMYEAKHRGRNRMVVA